MLNTTRGTRRTARPKRGVNNNHLTELREQAAVIGGDVRELAATAGQVAMSQVDPIEDFVRAKPLKSVLIAAGIGAIVGLIFFRR